MSDKSTPDNNEEISDFQQKIKLVMKQRSRRARFFATVKTLRGNWPAFVGMILVVFCVSLALFSEVIAPYEPKGRSFLDIRGVGGIPPLEYGDPTPATYLGMNGTDEVFELKTTPNINGSEGNKILVTIEDSDQGAFVNNEIHYIDGLFTSPGAVNMLLAHNMTASLNNNVTVQNFSGVVQFNITTDSTQGPKVGEVLVQKINPTPAQKDKYNIVEDMVTQLTWNSSDGDSPSIVRTDKIFVSYSVDASQTKKITLEYSGFYGNYTETFYFVDPVDLESQMETSAMATCDSKEINKYTRPSNSVEYFGQKPDETKGRDPKFHLLGTDQNGRDLWSRIVFGARTALSVGVLAMTISIGFGVVLGAVSGYFGGKIDELLMRIVDVWMAMPGFFLLLILVAAFSDRFGREFTLIVAMTFVGVMGIPGYARYIRGSILSVKEMDFVEAAKATGASDYRILSKHVIPNVLPIIIVYATLDIGFAIMTTASLSFLGLGATPGIQTDWGADLNFYQEKFFSDWWLPFFPGFFIFLVVLGLNLIGDWLRDVLDPRLSLD